MQLFRLFGGSELWGRGRGSPQQTVTWRHNDELAPQWQLGGNCTYNMAAGPLVGAAVDLEVHFMHATRLPHSIDKGQHITYKEPTNPSLKGRI